MDNLVDVLRRYTSDNDDLVVALYTRTGANVLNVSLAQLLADIDSHHAAALRAARAQGRAEAAEVADEVAADYPATVWPDGDNSGAGARLGAKRCAAAIRALT